MKVLMFVILFLLIGAFFIVSNQNIKLDSKENFNSFLKEYGKWFDQLVGNSKSASGYLIKMEWLPDEGKVS
ncbi:MAG: hypothetical protein Q8N63_00780 [Nanoarchaeota archaeon]|nr:hypothetical protein [Nanoarchaeota archaeon]